MATLSKCGASALRNKIGDRPVICEELDHDRYERIVAKCILNGEDIGEWMVLRGWAVAYVYYSYEYTRAEATAKAREETCRFVHSSRREPVHGT